MKVKYAILRWNGKTYDLLHYSHSYEDAQEMMEFYTEPGNNLTLMINAEDMHDQERRLNIKETFDLMIRELCKSVQVQPTK